MADTDCGGEGSHLSDEEREVLDKHSGTRNRPGTYAKAVAETQRRRAATPMPDLPHIDEVIAALTAAGQTVEPLTVLGFVDNAVVEVPGTEDSFTVREWLESGRLPDLVLQIIDQFKYGA